MTTFSFEHVTQAVTAAGLEIYRSNGSEIRIAERVRMHLMDSGVAVALRADPTIKLTIRIQRSDFPTAPADELFDKVRAFMQAGARQRGFAEEAAVARDITDPVDASQVLDVWHEITFAKVQPAIDALIDDLRWALDVPKCVEP